MKSVTIVVEGGIARIGQVDDGIEVDIIDLDVEGADDRDLCRCQKAEGAPHIHT